MLQWHSGHLICDLSSALTVLPQFEQMYSTVTIKNSKKWHKAQTKEVIHYTFHNKFSKTLPLYPPVAEQTYQLQGMRIQMHVKIIVLYSQIMIIIWFQLIFKFVVHWVIKYITMYTWRFFLNIWLFLWILFSLNRFSCHLCFCKCKILFKCISFFRYKKKKI